MIPDAGTLCRFSIMAERSPHTGDLVCGNTAPRSGPAENNGLICLSVFHGIDRFKRHIRPVGTVLSPLRPEIQDLMSALMQFCENHLDEIRVFIRTECNFHPVEIFSKCQSI